MSTLTFRSELLHYVVLKDIDVSFVRMTPKMTLILDSHSGNQITGLQLAPLSSAWRLVTELSSKTPHSRTMLKAAIKLDLDDARAAWDENGIGRTKRADQRRVKIISNV
ncbi:hypothetical protein GN244_ATG17802 [Phytophthora infestans]|uniref:Uncharacterized protein n=1 Tax=Phytophthora infestans TaxID=4787 RepID=A0A833S0W0_PHYIN|nr:hypothetical protein GN244_ATG17802 [Phytophthora infestans]